MAGKDKLGAVALGATRDLQALIDILNNTTIGSLAQDIASKADATALTDGLALKADAAALTLINAKINAIASVFGVLFNADGMLSTQTYTTHTHAYSDATINDTADGTGVVTDTSRNTQGVN